jgi:hypothetical protein
MPKRLITGREPILAEALAWLERKGIPPTHIQSVSINGTVGDVLRITATFIVDDPREVIDQPQEPACGYEGHPLTSHHCMSNGVPLSAAEIEAHSNVE